jgi:hypothetical protein
LAEKSLPALANKPLICVGDYTSCDPPDYPDNFLTAELSAELSAGLGEGWESGPVNLYHLSEDRFEKHHFTPFKDYTVWPQNSKLSDIVSKELKFFPPHERHQIQRLGKNIDFRHFLGNNLTCWVLRNLTTQEFVKSTAVAVAPHLHKGHKIFGLGFGEVLVARICWSSDPSCAMPYEGDIHRGVWAGHCFDIVSLATLKAEDPELTWRDVSEEVMQEVGAIWESEFGVEWKQVVEERVKESAKELREWRLLPDWYTKLR